MGTFMYKMGNTIFISRYKIPIWGRSCHVENSVGYREHDKIVVMYLRTTHQKSRIKDL
jgi:hypothetical protein